MPEKKVRHRDELLKCAPKDTLECKYLQGSSAVITSLSADDYRMSVSTDDGLDRRLPCRLRKLWALEWLANLIGVRPTEYFSRQVVSESHPLDFDCSSVLSDLFI